MNLGKFAIWLPLHQHLSIRGRWEGLGRDRADTLINGNMAYFPIVTQVEADRCLEVSSCLIIKAFMNLSPTEILGQFSDLHQAKTVWGGKR